MQKEEFILCDEPSVSLMFAIFGFNVNHLLFSPFKPDVIFIDVFSCFLCLILIAKYIRSNEEKTASMIKVRVYFITRERLYNRRLNGEICDNSIS